MANRGTILRLGMLIAELELKQQRVDWQTDEDNATLTEQVVATAVG